MSLIVTNVKFTPELFTKYGINAFAKGYSFGVEFIVENASIMPINIYPAKINIPGDGMRTLDYDNAITIQPKTKKNVHIEQCNLELYSGQLPCVADGSETYAYENTLIKQLNTPTIKEPYFSKRTDITGNEDNNGEYCTCTFTPIASLAEDGNEITSCKIRKKDGKDGMWEVIDVPLQGATFKKTFPISTNKTTYIELVVADKVSSSVFYDEIQQTFSLIDIDETYTGIALGTSAKANTMTCKLPAEFYDLKIVEEPEIGQGMKLRNVVKEMDLDDGELNTLGFLKIGDFVRDLKIKIITFNGSDLDSAEADLSLGPYSPMFFLATMVSNSKRYPLPWNNTKIEYYVRDTNTLHYVNPNMDTWAGYGYELKVLILYDATRY